MNRANMLPVIAAASGLRVISKPWFLFVPMVMLYGCVTPSSGPISVFSADTLQPTEIATIRPATAEEKQERRANLAIRLLVNPSGRGSLVRLLSISSAGSNEQIDLRGYSSVKVPAGSYIIRAECFLPSVTLFFKVPMDVRANSEYLLECTGNTGHSARINYRVLDEGDYAQQLE